MNADFDLGANWVLTAGARYTFEEKDVQVATSGQPACFGPARRCPVDFSDGDAWRNVTPKVGLQRWLGENAQALCPLHQGLPQRRLQPAQHRAGGFARPLPRRASRTHLKRG